METFIDDSNHSQSSFVGLQSMDKTFHTNSYDSMEQFDKRLESSERLDIKSSYHKSPSTRNKFLSIICGIICITCWIAQAHVVKQYDKPLLLMYICFMGYILLLPLWVTINICKKYKYK
eukprot:342634_1